MPKSKLPPPQTANRLFSLFDQRLKDPQDLVASSPQSLADMSPVVAEQNFALRKLQALERVVPLVDYSDFANFVFFNSACDYFNITGEKILNEYPYDGSRDLLQMYLNDLDDYQQYLVTQWPSWNGYLNFQPAMTASVVVADNGQDSDSQIAMGGKLAPTTSSWTVELWCTTPTASLITQQAMVLVQKTGSDQQSGYSIYFSGSSVVAEMTSGTIAGISGSSISAQATTQFVPGSVAYYSMVYDNINYAEPTVILYVGSPTSFPVPVASGSAPLGSLFIGTNPLLMATGTLPGLNVVPLSGAIDDVRIWNIPLGLSTMTSSFNAKVFAQDNLMGLWRFNESGSLIDDPVNNSIVLDYSGHKQNGQIVSPQGYNPLIRYSGSLLPFDQPDLILQLNAPEVQGLISVQQASGSAYDRASDNIITRFFPQEFFILEEFRNTTVLQNFLYILARNLDQIKVSIDQFLNVLRANYTDFNQTPDALLEEIGKFFGWKFTGDFLNADVFATLLGRGVLPSIQTNQELDTKLYEIKNAFWQRTLNNLIYLYKTKGTGESVGSLLRIYGVDPDYSFVRLKEFGVKPNVEIQTNRIEAQKSLPVLMMGSGTLTGTSNFHGTGSHVLSSIFNTTFQTVESRICFPTTASVELPETIVSGTIWVLHTPPVSGNFETIAQLYYATDPAFDGTGSLFFTSSNGLVVLSGAYLFDEKWHNISCITDPITGSISIQVWSINQFEQLSAYSASVAVPFLTASSNPSILHLGTLNGTGSQYWIQEVRVWEEVLSQQELMDHALNFQSYGTDTYEEQSNLTLMWRLREDLTADNTGSVGPIYDWSLNGNNGEGRGFYPNVDPYTRFLLDYNYIAPPEYGWNENKIRVINDVKLRPDEQFNDDTRLALEFNMVDALNEDISQIVSSLDGWNDSIGLAPNKFRETYIDLEALRTQYFKRLQGRLNFRLFADFIEFFDRSFLDMVKKLIPARADFLGDEFVVESHMLERPKHRYNYRRQEVPFLPSGSIQIWSRT